MPILLEVNVAGESSKHGFKPEQLLADLEAINALIAAGASLSALRTHWWQKLLACSELHRQQSILINSITRSIPERLVNLVQRHVRPIVRGKARAAVEFGAKISVSVQNGFPFLHRISWDAYNEGDDLIAQAEKYKQDNGCSPERICADRIYINTKNRHYCTRHGIRLSGKRLGRPPKDPEINAEQKQQLSADQRRRNEVEGVFGSGKRKYFLKLIMARLTNGAETSISMAFLVMCAEKILRLLRLFFVLISAWIYSLLRLLEPERERGLAGTRLDNQQWTDGASMVSFAALMFLTPPAA
jgi:hypothetical protein